MTAGCILIVLFQTFSGWVLFVSAMTLTLIAARISTSRLLRVSKRLRYIFLALLILFAWQTPGTLLIPRWGGWSPTLDGLRLAVEHGLRLLDVAALVAMLMQFLQPEEWIAGLYALASPLRLIGLVPERFAVRMHLVLQHVSNGERRDWRAWLDDTVGYNIDGVWALRTPAMLDICLIVTMLIACLGWLLCHG
ncbi:MAG TPA: CbiQ family ECF transporter T component [Rhodocyclaceae bacterium]|nr:CbiQ family ECF transporter T component [Rhodocyclaceae bacterium]